AIAVWNLDGSTGGLGKVSLTDYGSYASSLRVTQNDSPRYDHKKYAMPERPGAEVTLDVPDTAQPAQAFTAEATVRVPKDRLSASQLTASLSAPDGWSVSAPSPTSVERVQPGGSATFTWKVRPPAGTLPSASAITATVHYRQSGRQ